MDEQVTIDVTDAEEMLKRARSHLDREEPLKARALSQKAEATVRDRLALAHSAQRAIDFAENAIEKARRARVDTSSAEDILTRARRAMRNNEFYDAISLAERAVAATMVQPLPGRDMTVKTVLARVEGRVLYKVLLRNSLGKPLERLRVIPDTSNSIYVPAPDSAIVDLRPFGEETIYFDLQPPNVEAYAMEEFVPGRDVSVSTVLTAGEDGLVFRIKIRNETDRALETIHVEPYVPEGHIPAPSEAFVNIPPYGSRTVEFVLRPERRKKVDVELECMHCHGTFIVDKHVRKAICPWCHNEVDIQGLLGGPGRSGSGPPLPRRESPRGAGSVAPKARRARRRRPKAAARRETREVCSVCAGKGRVMVRGRKGRIKEQVCPRCKGVGKV